MLHANAKYIVLISQLVQTICHVAMHLTMHSNADVYMSPTNEQQSLLHSLQHTIHNYHHYCYQTGKCSFYSTCLAHNRHCYGRQTNKDAPSEPHDHVPYP